MQEKYFIFQAFQILLECLGLKKSLTFSTKSQNYPMLKVSVQAFHLIASVSLPDLSIPTPDLQDYQCGQVTSKTTGDTWGTVEEMNLYKKKKKSETSLPHACSHDLKCNVGWEMLKNKQKAYGGRKKSSPVLVILKCSEPSIDGLGLQMDTEPQAMLLERNMLT